MPHHAATSIRLRSSALAFTLLLLISAVSVPISAASDPECTVGTFVGACSFSGSTTGGVYIYDRITIPAGVTVTALLPVVLHARDELKIEGDLIDTPEITLISDLVISISGSVGTTDGTIVNPAGGNIRIISYLLGVSGTIRSGDGAPGLDMTQDVGDTQTAASAIGGPGGNGGDITIIGATTLFSGQVFLGNGGRGGDAITLGGTLSATATAGPGGASGQLVLPPGYDPITLHKIGQLSGGQGGQGGEAIAITEQAVAPVGDDGTDVTNNQGAVVACSGASKSWPPGERGNSGCTGAEATAAAGNGAYGLVTGGAGGSAFARGGQGGTGGRGVDGSTFDCVFVNTQQPSCHAYYGGQGGFGGRGGPAQATGGRGGDSLIEGGEGGDANAEGGRGGTGGVGGANGGGRVWGWTGSNIGAVATAIGCVLSFIPGPSGTTPIALLACALSVFDNGVARFVCGESGRAGQGEWGGTFSSRAGEGGRNLEGFGVKSADGSSGGTTIGTGDAGQAGASREIFAMVNAAPAQFARIC